MQKITVSNACVACGSCTLSTNFLVEQGNGKVIPKGLGILSNEEASTLKSIIESCPIRAISLQVILESNVDKNEKARFIELKQSLQDTLGNYKIHMATQEEVACDKSKLQIDLSRVGLRSKYSYTSYEKAEKDGLQEFNRIACSQKEILVQSILVQYKKIILDKFTKYEEASTNYYFAENKKIEEMLKSFYKQAIEISNGNFVLPQNVTEFTVVPKELDLYGYGVVNFEKTRVCSEALKNVESLSWYKPYINSDERSLSTKSVYCYDLHEAVETIGKHIIDGCIDGIRQHGQELLHEVLNWHQKRIESELKKKVEVFMNAIDSYVKKIN